MPLPTYLPLLRNEREQTSINVNGFLHILIDKNDSLFSIFSVIVHKKFGFAGAIWTFWDKCYIKCFPILFIQWYYSDIPKIIPKLITNSLWSKISAYIIIIKYRYLIYQNDKNGECKK